VLEAGEVDWLSALSILKTRRELWSSLQGVSLSHRESIDWRTPPREIVGAVIEPADVQRAANNPDDYYPRLPPPDLGFLPEDTPLEVLDEPDVDVSEVGEELVFSANLAEFLAPLCEGKLGEVRMRGRTLTGYRRLFPRAKGRILADINRGRPVPCTLCGAPLVPSLGVWIADADAAFPKPVVQEAIGIDHLGQRHPLLVDPLTARILDANFAKGLALEPIFSSSSETATWARSVLHEVGGT
jgi:hypothetical protein